MISGELAIFLCVCAVIYFIIGAIWYSPIGLGKPWMKAVGLTQEMMNSSHNMMKAMIVSYLVCLFQVFVIVMVVSHLKVQMVIYSAVIGALIALAFGLLSAVRSHHYVKRNMMQMAIDHGYDVVASAVIAGLATWWLAH